MHGQNHIKNDLVCCILSQFCFLLT